MAAALHTSCCAAGGSPATPDELRAHLERRVLRHVPEGESAHAVVAALHLQALSDLADELDLTARPCGCKEGAVGVVAALVAWPVWLVTRRRPSSVIGWAAGTAEAVPVALAGAGVFKTAGIVRGHLRYRQLRRRLAKPRGPGSRQS